MRLAVSLVLMLLLAPILSGTSAGLTRSTTVWSGTISLPDGYLVQSNQVLVIQAGTSILLGDGERLGVDGRISIEGTESSPVSIESISGDHRGPPKSQQGRLDARLGGAIQRDGECQ